MDIILLIIGLAIGSIGAYFIFVYIYGDKNPKKWKSKLFSKNDTFKNTFFPNKGKGKQSERKNS